MNTLFLLALSAAAMTFDMSALRALPKLNTLMIKQEAPKAAAKGQRYIRLTGNVHLSGSGHVSGQSPWVTVTVSGWTTLRDNEGRTLSGQVHLTDTQTYHLSGNHVSGWARPRAYVSIYNNGRYLGNINVDGSVYVSGWNNGGWINLSGSGYVDGSGYIDEPEEPQQP